jgi:hypothetical protein
MQDAMQDTVHNEHVCTNRNANATKGATPQNNHQSVQSMDKDKDIEEGECGHQDEQQECS